VQGVVKSYDPGTGQGTLVVDTDLSEYDLARDALEGSIFRMLRQGQRVVFELDGTGLATRLRIGSEIDMATPVYGAGSQAPTPVAKTTATAGYNPVADDAAPPSTEA
jgi:cold shock CspA family protein